MCKISVIESRQPKHSGKVQQQRHNDGHPTKLNKEDTDRLREEDKTGCNAPSQSLLLNLRSVILLSR